VGGLVLLLTLATCAKQNVAEPEPGSGQVRLMMTDFPVSGRDISQVNVQIMRIEVNTSTALSASSSTALSASGDAGWFTTIDFGAMGRIFDLLKLQNGNTVELGAFNLPVGNYQQIRLILGVDNSVLVNEGAGYVVRPLATPSGLQTGLKLVDAFTVMNQGYTTIMVDFDAAKSLKYAGGIYQLSPTIRVLSVDTSQNYFGLTPSSIAGATLMPTLTTGITINPQLPPNGLMALHSINIGNNVIVNSNVFTLGICTSTGLGTSASTSLGTSSSGDQCLTTDLEANTGTAVTLSLGKVLRANRVHLGANTTIQGTVGFNTLTQDAGVTIAAQTTPPGEAPGMPDFLKGKLGLQNITAVDSPLAAGLYYTLSLADNTSIQLTGGNYHLDSIILGNNTSIRCMASCVLLVKSFIITGSGSTLVAQNNDSNYLNIFVAGASTPSSIGTGENVVQIGGGNIIRANFHVPYATLNFGVGTQFTGFALANKIIVGDGSVITGNTAQLVISGQYVAQAVVQGAALQYHFIGNGNQIRMLSSNQLQYIYNGTYQFNTVTKQAFITYDTVDLINPDCLPCQTTGIYPPLATYPATTFSIPAAYTGFELVSFNNTTTVVKLISTGEIVTFKQRLTFGPFDQAVLP